MTSRLPAVLARELVEYYGYVQILAEQWNLTATVRALETQRKQREDPSHNLKQCYIYLNYASDADRLDDLKQVILRRPDHAQASLSKHVMIRAAKTGRLVQLKWAYGRIKKRRAKQCDKLLDPKQRRPRSKYGSMLYSKPCDIATRDEYANAIRYKRDETGAIVYGEDFSVAIGMGNIRMVRYMIKNRLYDCKSIGSVIREGVFDMVQNKNLPAACHLGVLYELEQVYNLTGRSMYQDIRIYEAYSAVGNTKVIERIRHTEWDTIRCAMEQAAQHGHVDILLATKGWLDDEIGISDDSSKIYRNQLYHDCQRVARAEGYREIELLFNKWAEDNDKQR